MICRIISAKGVGRDWENIVGFPAGTDEREKATQELHYMPDRLNRNISMRDGDFGLSGQVAV